MNYKQQMYGDYLSHKDRTHHKYIKKIKTTNGWRYIYKNKLEILGSDSDVDNKVDSYSLRIKKNNKTNWFANVTNNKYRLSITMSKAKNKSTRSIPHKTVAKGKTFVSTRSNSVVNAVEIGIKKKK